MPKIPTYTANENLDTDRRGMPRVVVDTSAQEIAARTGRTISGLGNQIADAGFDLMAQQRSREEKVSQLNTRVQEDNFQTQWALKEAELKNGMREDGFGYAEGVLQKYDEEAPKFLSTVPENLRPQYQARIAQHRNAVALAAANEEQRVTQNYAGKFIEDWVTAQDARLSQDPSMLEAARAEAKDRVNIAMIPERLKPEVIKKIEARFEGIAAAKASDNPEEVERLMGVKFDAGTRTSQRNARTVGGVEGGIPPSGVQPRENAGARLQDKSVTGYVNRQSAIWGPRASRAVGTLMQEAGLTREQAAGLVGNLVQESSLKTSARNPGDGRDGSDSIGVSQWNSDRATALKRFAAAQGKDWQDFDTQIRFVAHELKTSESGALARIKGAQTVEEAAAAGISYFRPAGWKANDPSGSHGYRYRIANAQKIAGMEPTGGGDVRTGTQTFTVTGDAAPQYRNMTLEQRQEVVKNAWIAQSKRDALLAEQITAQQTALEKSRAALIDDAEMRAVDGKLTRAEYDDMEASGVFTKESERKRVRDKLEASETAAAAASDTLAKIEDPEYVFSPGDKEDKDRVEGFFTARKLEDRMMKRDPDAQAEAVAIVARTGIIPASARDRLENMVLTGTKDQFAYALQTLDRMDRTNQGVFKEALGADNRALLTKFQDGPNKDVNALYEEFRKNYTPEGARLREAREKEATKIVADIDAASIVKEIGGDAPRERMIDGMTVSGAEQIKSDYARAFREQYRILGDEAGAKKNALAAVKGMWQVAPSAGNRLIKNSPESLVKKGLLPPTDMGDWITEQIQQDLASTMPPVRDIITGRDIPASPRHFALVPYRNARGDDVTAEQIKAMERGQPVPGGPVWSLTYSTDGVVWEAKPFRFNVENAIKQRVGRRDAATEANRLERDRLTERDSLLRDEMQPTADFMRQRQEQNRRMGGEPPATAAPAANPMRQPVSNFEGASMNTPPTALERGRAAVGNVRQNLEARGTLLGN